jgi:hypothetical protein
VIELDMACAVCAYALTFNDDNGQVTFEHPVAPDSGHDPQPVPAHELDGVYRRCHLCSSQAPVWIYRTPQIEALSYGGTRHISQSYSTQWHVCYPCAQLIDQGDAEAVSRRSIAVMGWHPTSPHAQILAGIHRTIVLTREPGRTLLTTRQWSPASLKAAILPKVRDRLTGLLRGPIGLPPPLNAAELRALLADGLDQARLYWIDPQFSTLVADVLADLPDTSVTERIVPAAGGLLAWSTPLDQPHRIAAASWTPRQDGWQILCYRSVGTDLPADLMETVRHEIGWLAPVHGVHVRRDAVVNGGDPLAGLFATWLIIAQQLTQEVPASVDPPIRRAYARAHRRPPDVRLVRIKPSSPQSTVTAGQRTLAGRAKPDYRYWVSGHERNQAYGPGRSLRKKIDIDPYLKGPEDKPIKASTTVRVLGSARKRSIKDDDSRPNGS